MQTFSIKEALSWGWQKFKERPWFFIGIILIVFVVSGILGFLSDEDVVGSIQLLGLGQLLSAFIQWWLYIGVIGILLNIYDNKSVEIGQIFSQKFKTLLNYVFATILYFLIVLGGFILLIVPGIIWSIKFHYYIFFIVDRGMGPIEALKASASLTKGYKWTILGFLAFLGLLNLAGVLVLGVGLFVSLPVTLLASVWVYRWLEKNAQSQNSSTKAIRGQPLQTS